MAKKIFVRARVVKGRRWTIEYFVFNPSTGEQTRHRKEFNLNSIEKIEVREEVAKILCDHLEEFCGPVIQEDAPKTKPISVQNAVLAALEEKLKLPRKNSHRTYKTVVRSFLQWATDQQLLNLPAVEFTRKHARLYWDFLTSRKKYRAATQANYKVHLCGLWSEAESRETVKENPWKGIKLRNLEEKLRRPFTEAEMRTVATVAMQTDYWLFRAILLQYFCFIRPVEIARLKFCDFDLARGVVVISAANAKKWRRRVATIPKSVLPFFVDGRFDKYPGNYYVLGKFDQGRQNYTLEPCTVPIGDDRMYKRHKKLLERLNEDGHLGDITGLTYYSWKDTGITRHAKKTAVTATKEQAGHTNLAVTSRYYHGEVINYDYQGLPLDLI